MKKEHSLQKGLFYLPRIIDAFSLILTNLKLKAKFGLCSKFWKLSLKYCTAVANNIFMNIWKLSRKFRAIVMNVANAPPRILKCLKSVN